MNKGLLMGDLPADIKLENSVLARMLGYLECDPSNLRLLADCIELAAKSGETDIVIGLLDQYTTIAPLPPSLLHHRVQTAMSKGQWQDAADDLVELLKEVGPAPALRFNLAWAKAMLLDYAGALELLDDPTLEASPRAPALKARMMHHLDQYEEALSGAEQLLERFPNNHELAGALATIAIDADDLELALKFAKQAAEYSNEAAAALGTIKMGEFDLEEASRLFDHALKLSPFDARARIGKGLALLISGQADAAAELDQGAELFKDHIGSWIAAGWAYFTNGKYDEARERFERALAIDDNFAESHGALAVLDIIAGRPNDAQRRVGMALRLDRECFSAILAKSLLLESSGREAAAQTLRERAMTIPIGEQGMTIAVAAATLGLKRQRKGSPQR